MRKIMVILALAIACSTLSSFAEDACLDYGNYMHWLNSLPSRSIEADVIVTGNLAYISRSGLVAVDISNPETPREIGSVNLNIFTEGMDLIGNHIFISEYGTGDVGFLGIVNISDPYSPALISQTDVGCRPVDVAATSEVAVLACPRNIPVIVDVRNLDRPIVVGMIPTSGNGIGVGYGNGVFAICEDVGLVSFWALDDPVNPIFLGSVEIGYREPLDILIDGETAYVAAGSIGVVVLDISSPDAPRVVSEFNTASLAVGLDIDDSVLYIADGAGSGYISGIYSVDVSNPQSPVKLGYRAVVDSATEIGVDDGIVCVSTRYYSGMQVFNATNPATEPENIGLSFSPWRSFRVAANHDRVLLYGTGTKYFVNISDPSASFIEYQTPSEYGFLATYDVAIQDSWIFAIEKDFIEQKCYLSIYQYKPEVGPIRKFRGLIDGNANRLAVSGDRMVVIVNGHAVAVDISDPALPVLGSTYELTEYPSSLEMRERVAFVGDSTELLMLDVSDIFNPTVLSRISTVARCADIFLNGEFAIISQDYAGIRIIDISDIQHPFTAGTFNPLPRITSTCGYGDVLYSYLSGGGGADIELNILVISIADPAAPKMIGTIGGYGISGLDVFGENVFYCQETGGEAQFIVTPVQCSDQTEKQNFGMVKGSKLDKEANFVTSSDPNPFHPSTTISFSLHDFGPTSLIVYDILGRQIKTLISGNTLDAGIHQAYWDGRDDRGRTVAAGVYFYLLESGGHKQTGRMVMVR
ncbi:MAG: hypothetical protein AB7V45_02895 [Candidatus Krumholzibacteriia bacterium]